MNSYCQIKHNLHNSCKKYFFQIDFCWSMYLLKVVRKCNYLFDFTENCKKCCVASDRKALNPSYYSLLKYYSEFGDI